MMQARLGDLVRVHYTGLFSDGTQFDTSDGAGPVRFVIGDGTLLPAFEHAVIGMRTGQRRTVTIPAREAYGWRRAELVRTLPRRDMPEEIDLRAGRHLITQTEDGQDVELRIVEVTPQSVTLDANHPLAGRDLVYEVELIEVAAGQER